MSKKKNELIKDMYQYILDQEIEFEKNKFKSAVAMYSQVMAELEKDIKQYIENNFEN